MESNYAGDFVYCFHVNVTVWIKTQSIFNKKRKEEIFHHWALKAAVLILKLNNTHALQKQQHDTLRGKRKTSNGNDL